MTKDPHFIENKEDVIDNLEAIQLTLQQCTAAGMLDLEDSFHNEVLDLIDEALLSKSSPELSEVIVKGKTLEVDMDTWLALKGRTTLSLTWPSL
jgi:hypothetical protein